MAYGRYLWARPYKALQYYIFGKPNVPSFFEAEWQLWTAVTEGSVRAKHLGRIMSAEEAFALRNTQWDSTGESRYTLPADILLSVEDIERIWTDESTSPSSKKAAKPQTKGTVQPKFSKAKLETAYKNYRAKCVEEGKIPSRDNDVSAMRNALGPTVPVKTIYELRSKLAPVHWKARGRRRST